VIQKEFEGRPQFHLNTSSDRIGTPKGFQQYSATIAKTVPGTKLAPFASLTYSEFEEGLVFPFGASYALTPEVQAMYLHDGRRGHLLGTYSQESWYVQVGLVWFKRLSFTVGWGF
jgi:hypothetical protein